MHAFARLQLAAALVLTLPLAGPVVAGAAQGRTVELVAGDDMKFNTGTIEARAGEALRIVVRSQGQMPKVAMAHNFVLLAPGTDPASFANEGAMHRGSDFIAPGLASRVIAKTPMAGAGESVEVSFTAPGPGSYPFVCTFPGHVVAGMTGTLVVQ
jgi:azurin